MGWTKEDEEAWKAAERARILEEVGNLMGIYNELEEPKSPAIKKVDVIAEVRRMSRENLFYYRIFIPRRGYDSD